MARPKILRGTYVNILMGNGAEPQVYNPLCGLTARTFQHTVNTQDTFVRDCADPEDIPSRELLAVNELWELSGTGLVDRNNLDDIIAAMKVIKDYRYELGQPAGDTVFGGYWAGEAMLTSMRIVGDDGAFASLDLTWLSNADWVWTAVP